MWNFIKRIGNFFYFKDVFSDEDYFIKNLPADSRVKKTDLKKALDRIVLSSLKPVSESLCILFVLLAIFHVIFLPKPIVFFLTFSEVATAIFLLGLRYILDAKNVPESWAHPIGAIIAGFVLLNSLMLLYLTMEPRQTTSLLLLIIGAGFLFLSSRWFILILLATVFGWLAIGYKVNYTSEWAHFGFALVSGIVLAVIGHVIRGQSLSRLELLRLEDAIIKADLEKSLGATEEARKVAEVAREKLEVAMLAVNQSEERFRRLSEVTVEGIVIQEKEKIIDCNQALARMFGYEAPEILTKNILDLIAPEFRDFVSINILANFDKPYEAIGLRKDGSEFPIEIHSKITPNKDKMAHVVAVRDITERKKAEESLKESEERYRELFENASDLILSFDKRGKFLYVNQQWLNTLGYTKEEWPNLTIQNILRQDQLEYCGGIFNKLINGEKIGHLETIFVSKSGQEILVEGSANSYFKEEKFFGIRGIFRDITERKRFEKILKEQLNFLQRLIDNIPNPVFFKNMNGIYFGLNEAFEKFTGRPKGQIIGKSGYDILPQGLAYKDHQMDMALFSRPGVQNYEFCLNSPDGKTQEVIFNKTTFTREDGAAAGIVGVIVDITRQKETERIMTEHAKELEILSQIIISGNRAENLGTLLENILNSILVSMGFDGGGIYLLNEEKNLAELKYAQGLEGDFKEEIKIIKIDAPPYNTVFINKQPILTDNFPAAFPEKAQKFNFLSFGLIPLFSKDRVIGAINIVSSQRHPFSDFEKRVFQSIGQNLGSAIVKMQIEDALKISEEKYRDLIESANSIILRLDAEGRITFFNKFAQKFFGYSEEEISGRKMVGTILPDIESTGQEMEAMIKEIGRLPEKFLSSENENIRRSGERVWIAWTNKAILDETGKLSEILCIGNDITERIQLEKLKDGFLSSVSHEIRTPLSIVKEGISLVLERVIGEINEKQNKILAISKENVDRLTRIINSVLDISKIEAGKVVIYKEIVNINNVIKQITATFENKARDKGLVIKTNVEGKEINLAADEDKIIQVFTNLVGNAIKFTEEGTIEISAIDKENEVECAVADTGRGIAEIDMPKLFNKFQQIGREVGPGEKGTGLGLSIVKGIIDLHNGQIRIESRLGQGSKFIFSIPKGGGTA